MPRYAQDLGAAIIVGQVAYVRVGVVDQAPDGTYPSSNARTDAVGAWPSNIDRVFIGGYTYSQPDDNGVTYYTPEMRAISRLQAHSNSVYEWPDDDPNLPTQTLFTAPSAGVIRIYNLYGQSGAHMRIYINGVQEYLCSYFCAYNETDSIPLTLAPGDVVKVYCNTTVFCNFLPNSH